MERIRRVRDKMALAGYKLTHQREVVLRTILENEKKHLSAEEIYVLVKKKEPRLGLATVYRTIEMLNELGVLHKMDFGDGRARYDFSLNEVHHHHHLICNTCGKVIEVQNDFLEQLEDEIERKYHFQISNHHVQFYGRCKECQEREEAQPTQG